VRVARLDDMKGGWFAGDFAPTVFRTALFEAACKRYRAGETEARHVHRVATEITVIAAGVVRLNGRVFRQGDVVELEPNEPADFSVLEDAITMVIKVPSVVGDKHLI
jgi:hypothetical protein